MQKRSFYLRGSIFFRLIGILIITGVLLNFLVYFALKYFADQSPIRRDLFENYREDNLKAYVADIGFPPNEKMMQSIRDLTDGEIRIESECRVWETANNLPSLAQVERHQKKDREEKLRKKKEEQAWLEEQAAAESGSLISGPSHRGLRGPPPGKRIPVFFDVFAKVPPRPAFILSENGVKYGFFLPDTRDFSGRYGRLIIPLLLLLTFLIASAFFAIRYILLPVNTLMKGVARVSSGDLSSKVEVRGGGEFGALGDAFNQMVERIRETLEAKERLLVDVSHELQSPLARMKLAIELTKDEKAKERLKLNLKDLETMVAEILESARLDSSSGSLSLQKTDLGKLIKEFLYVYEAMGSPVIFETSQVLDGTVLEIDPSRMIVVLRNLVDNALKHADHEDKRVVLRLVDQKSKFRIEVSDNGRGIDEGEIPKLFEPFYRIDKSRTRATGGYGLGLSLCKRIVDAHQGEIGITSTKDGTTVWFTLPKTKAP